MKEASPSRNPNELLNNQIDNKFVTMMLQIEKRYQPPYASFSKYEKIRIEQWVTFILYRLVQEIVSGNSELAVEEKSELVRDAPIRPNSEQETGEAVHQVGSRVLPPYALAHRSCN